MPGMGGSLSTSNPVIVDAFHSAIRRQALVVALLLLIAAAAWALRKSSGRRPGMASPGLELVGAEHPARRLLRVGFGIIWVVDGLLQAQSAMPLGLPTQVVQPAAATSPGWVQRLVNDGLSIWTRHPIPAATSVIWIQIGVGALLLLSPRGRLSRLAGVVSIGWGLVVWVFGEAFGGLFGSGFSWMFGAPGAVLLYCAAGLLIALPDRLWWKPTLGRVLVRSVGLFLLGMALLQAWPGRGFWQGQANPSATAGGLTAMAQAMSQTPQPAILSSLVRSFASFDSAHGWAVNLVAVVALAGVGAALLSARPRLVRPAVGVGIGLSLLNWIFVQDLGFFGGVGTDPNSMIPMALLLGAAELALLRPASAIARDDSTAVSARLARRSGSAAALAAFGVVLVGAVPMAFASVNPSTDAILTEGINGQPDQTNIPAPPINLSDQNGQPISLSSLRGRTVALTFLDPVCTTDCPIIAQQFRQVDKGLGAAATKTAFVAVVANPIYRGASLLQAFDQQENLESLPNWYFLTGSVSQLSQVWSAYGIEIQTISDGGMVAHGDNAFVIDANGRLREQLGADPGQSSSTAESLSTLLGQEMRSVMES